TGQQAGSQGQEHQKFFHRGWWVMDWSLGCGSGVVDQTAASPFSSVRMRMTCSTVETKILPSPILPVLAALMMAATAVSTLPSGTTSSILILGRKSTVYSLPR